MPHRRNDPVPEGIPDRVPVTDELDLHGFFPEQVPEILEAFMDHAKSLGLSRLRVVHGKGKSRLKYEVHRFLKSRTDVEDYCDAPPESGGWGATLILLKKRKI
ncbi:Smr/MutS family protein [bacterium]|nr:Smr/MutS family protein [bacterium]